MKLDMEFARRIARQMWIGVSKANNPYSIQLTSLLARGANESARASESNFKRWYDTQILLLRALHGVVFNNEEPTEELLKRSMDFLDGDPKALTIVA